MDKSDVLHKLIDVVSGRQAHLSSADADELHEAVTPGYSTPPPSDDAIAAARAVLAAAEAPNQGNLGGVPDENVATS